MRSRHIYLASTWENRYELRPVRDELERRGHVVTSTWIDVGAVDYPREIGAKRDYDDLVIRACTLVLWPDDLRKKTTGKYVEFGMAIGAGLEIFIVQPETSSCIFVSLQKPWIHRVASFEELYTALEQ